jgi:uncharacterized protein
MPTVVHFEIPADDLPRAKKFYERLFDWKVEPYGACDPADYYMIETTAGEGEPAVCGGLMARKAPEHHPMNYIGVRSVDEFAAKVQSLGGQVVMPKTLVPDHGYFVVCLDTEGNAFGLWECLKKE